ncbi:MAG: hypothetical protein ACRDHY_02995 [Anaerolineales bacterium]
MYAVLRRLEAGRNVLRLRLLDGKWTYIDRGLWPAVLRIVARRRAWQAAGVSPLGRRILERVNRIGVLDLQNRARLGGVTLGAAGDAARELEHRLLVVSYEIHTLAGLHSKRLESWASWKERHGARVGGMREPEARRRIESLVAAMAPEGGPVRALPWMPARARRRSPPRRGKAGR